MKLEKTKKSYALIGIVFIIPIICLILSSYLPAKLHLYDTMTGADGLKNVIVAIILKYALGFIFSIPIFILGIVFLVGIFRKRKNINHPIFLFSGVLLLTVSFPLFFYFAQNRTRFRIQQSNKDISGFFAEAKFCISCYSDILTDDYDEFTVNKCDVYYRKYLTSPIRRGTYHNEYEVRFYYNETLVVQMQTGKNEFGYLVDLIPAEFDTKITVYKKSGFLRSVEPSVEFDRSESYEHFFNISYSGDWIIYEKNIEADLEELQWSGFRKNESNDIHNGLFGIGVSEERPYLDADYARLRCDEVCLYAIVDGQYRRVSNILTENYND